MMLSYIGRALISALLPVSLVVVMVKDNAWKKDVRSKSKVGVAQAGICQPPCE